MYTSREGDLETTDMMLTLCEPTAQAEHTEAGHTDEERFFAAKKICKATEKEEEATLAQAGVSERLAEGDGEMLTELRVYAEMTHCSLYWGMLRSLPRVGSAIATAVLFEDYMRGLSLCEINIVGRLTLMSIAVVHVAMRPTVWKVLSLW